MSDLTIRRYYVKVIGPEAFSGLFLAERADYKSACFD